MTNHPTLDTSRIELGDRHPDTGMVLLKEAGGWWWGDLSHETAEDHQKYVNYTGVSRAVRNRHAALAVMRRAFNQAEKDGVDVDDRNRAHSEGFFPDDDVSDLPGYCRAHRYLAREVQALVDAGKPLNTLPYEVRDHRTVEPECGNENDELGAACRLGTHGEDVWHSDRRGNSWSYARVEQDAAPQATPTADTDDEPWRLGRHFPIHVYAGDRPVATFHSANDAERAVNLHVEVQTAREARETAERELAGLRAGLRKLEGVLWEVDPKSVVITAMIDRVRFIVQERNAARAEVERLHVELAKHEGDVQFLLPKGSVVFPPGDPMHDVARIMRDLPEVGEVSGDCDIAECDRVIIQSDHSDAELLSEVAATLKILLWRASEAGRAEAPTEDDIDDQVRELGDHIMDAVSGYEGEAYAVGNAVLNLVETFQDAHRAACADKENDGE